MKEGVISFVAGVVFAVGLAISGMCQPAKIVAFLDFTGRWDPSLALVMGGGLAVLFVAQMVVRRRAAPLFATAWRQPVRTTIDARLLAGAAIFGVGWGVAGYCPGPAIVSFAGAARNALVFLPAMALGVVLFHLIQPGTQSAGEETAPSAACE